MDFQFIIFEKEKGIGTITLNRPRSFNALNRGMIDELLRAVKDMSTDAEVKVLILTGAGRAFCFEADVEEFREAMAQSKMDATLELLAKSQEIIQLLPSMPKPIWRSARRFFRENEKKAVSHPESAASHVKYFYHSMGRWLKAYR